MTIRKFSSFTMVGWILKVKVILRIQHPSGMDLQNKAATDGDDEAVG
jgi:hypothetical protein